jgi:hypothetical protein
MGRGNIIHRRRRESRLSWVILKVTLDDLKATSSPGPFKKADTQPAGAAVSNLFKR